MESLRVTYHRPALYQKQYDCFFILDPLTGREYQFNITEASTKTGKTVGAIAWIWEGALFGKHGQNFWWIAPIKAQAKIAYDRLVRYINKYAKDLVQAGLIKKNETDRTIEVVGAGKLWFKGADDPDSLYGEDVYRLVIDEATRCKELAWVACFTTITATNGMCRIIGNVKGNKNWAYKLAQLAKAGEPGWHYNKLICKDAVEAGIITQHMVDIAEKLLPEDLFRELYYAKPSDMGGNPFGLKHIQNCLGKWSTLPTKYWGIDFGRKVDNNAIHGLDEYGQSTHTDAWLHKPWKETRNRLRARINGDSSADGSQVWTDATGIGDPLTENVTDDLPNHTVEGYMFTNKSKQELMESLAISFQQKQITIPIEDEKLTNELEAFEYEVKGNTIRYSAPEGMHDDRVMALALANKAYHAPMLAWDF
jgi:phage FluMu gp28-like protein